MKTIYYGIWLAAALLCGCTDGFSDLTPQGRMALTLVAADLGNPPTKSVSDAAIANLWVLQFDGTDDYAAFVSKQSYDNPATNNLTLTNLKPGSNQTLIFAGNLNITTVSNFSGNLGAFKALALTVTDEASLFPNTSGGTSYIPMISEWSGDIVSNDTGVVPEATTINMVRTVARISFTLKSGLAAGATFNATSVRLHRVPNTMRLVETNGTNFPATPTTVDYAAVSGGTINATGKTYTWYLPENRRGTGSATTTKDKNETTAAFGQGQYTTYIEVVGNYTTAGLTRVVRYRVWPGGNSMNDYNLRRNSSYNITTTLRNAEVSTSRVDVYGAAYTGIVEPEDNENNANSLPFLENTHSVRQTGKTTADATTRLIIDGGDANKATVRGFVYSTTAKTVDALQLGKSGVSNAPQTGSFATGAYTLSLTGLTPATTYYIRAYATNPKGTGYSDITTFVTPPIQPFANCFMVEAGQTVMFETKDAVGGARNIAGAQLLWQTRNNGTTNGPLPVLAASDIIYDSTNKVIIVHTNPACTAANAVIRDNGSGVSSWTWHLWITPYRPGSATLTGTNLTLSVPMGRVHTFGTKYQTAVGTGKTIMDRALGNLATSVLLTPAHAATDAAFYTDLFYQWGECLPWTSPTKGTSTPAPVYGLNGQAAAPLATHFKTTVTGTWGTNKSASDPCPSGWRVPPAGTYDDLAYYGVFPISNTGANTGANTGRMYIQGGVNAWFFCNGSRTGANAFSLVNSNGYVWTSTAVDGSNAIGMAFYNGSVLPQNSLPKTRALPVRCVRQ